MNTEQFANGCLFFGPLNNQLQSAEFKPKFVLQQSRSEATPEAGYQRWEDFLKVWGQQYRSNARQKPLQLVFYLPELCSIDPSDGLEDELGRTAKSGLEACITDAWSAPE